MQTGQRRIRQLSEQLLAAQAQLAKKDEQIKEERELRRQVENKVQDLNTQLENNAGQALGRFLTPRVNLLVLLVVFEMHFSELLRRNEEIERLTAVIEGLSASNS